MTMLLCSEALAKSHIKGYTKLDGTVVKPHEDKRFAGEKKPPAKWSSGAPSSSVHAPQYGLFGGGGHSTWPYAAKNAPTPTPKAYHPKPGDKGQKVGIYYPHKDSAASLSDSNAIATITPGCKMPKSLNGVAFAPWTPPAEDQWDYVEGQNDDLVEGHLSCPPGKEPASGLLIVEPDGRVWVVSPTNRFGGYKNTFPKGKVEQDLSFQANAIKEAWEEGGIKANIIGLLGDVERTTSVTRYYLARRVAGNPAADMGWESQAAHLVPISQLDDFMDSKVDRQVANLLGK